MGRVVFISGIPPTVGMDEFVYLTVTDFAKFLGISGL